MNERKRKTLLGSYLFCFAFSMMERGGGGGTTSKKVGVEYEHHGLKVMEMMLEVCVCVSVQGGKYLFVIPLWVCVCAREENEALLSPREHFRLLRVLLLLRLRLLRLHPPASVCSIQDFSHLSTQPASARPRGCLLPSGAFSVAAAAAVYNSHLSLSLSLSPVGQVEVSPSPRLCLMKYKGRSQQTQSEKSIRIKGKETGIKKRRESCVVFLPIHFLFIFIQFFFFSFSLMRWKRSQLGRSARYEWILEIPTISLFSFFLVPVFSVFTVELLLLLLVLLKLPISGWKTEFSVFPFWQVESNISIKLLCVNTKLFETSIKKL